MGRGREAVTAPTPSKNFSHTQTFLDHTISRARYDLMETRIKAVQQDPAFEKLGF